MPDANHTTNKITWADIPKPSDALHGQATIAITAGASGVGKTTTALCLAGAISKGSVNAGELKKVVVVDFDHHNNKIGSLLGQYMPTAISLRFMPTLSKTTVLANLIHDNKLCIDALLSPIRPINSADVGPDFYQEVVQILQTTHDVVILNLPTDYRSPLSRLGYAISDMILCVTSLATPSVELMARALTDFFVEPENGGLGIVRAKVGIIANMAMENVGMGRDKIIRAGLGSQLVGAIPLESEVVLAATNNNDLATLLEHDRLGPSYDKLARMCLPGFKLQNKTPEPLPLNKINSKTIKDIDLSEYHQAIYEKYYNLDKGLIIISGDTGSGKTSTLYATLNSLDPNKKVVTIENPVKAKIANANQINVNKSAGFDFGTLIRSALRKDPDVLMIGEIRDLETAEAAIEASSSCLAVAPFHSSDPVSSLERLANLLNRRPVVAYSIKLILQQCLVPRLCNKCAVKYEPSIEELASISIAWDEFLPVPRIKKAVGCYVCKDTGYLGQIAIYELLEVNSTIEDLVVAKASSQEIREAALQINEMKPITQDGWEKILQEDTTIEAIRESIK